MTLSTTIFRVNPQDVNFSRAQAKAVFVYLWPEGKGLSVTLVTWTLKTPFIQVLFPIWTLKNQNEVHVSFTHIMHVY